MLHPALTRVLSVVLAIVCVILLLSAVFGFSDARQSAQLTAEREIPEQQKENENKLRSKRILLMQNKEAEEMVNAGGDLAEGASIYAESFQHSYENQYLCGVFAACWQLLQRYPAFSHFLPLLKSGRKCSAASPCAHCSGFLRHRYPPSVHAWAEAVLFRHAGCVFALCYFLAAFPKKKQPTG